MRAEGIGENKGGGIDWREDGLQGRRVGEWMIREEGIGRMDKRRVKEWMMGGEGIGGKEGGGMHDKGGGDWREREWRNG